MRLDYADGAAGRIRRPALRKERFMDRITESLLDEFCRENELTALPQDEQFEHFSAFITISRNYPKSFSSTMSSSGKATTLALMRLLSLSTNLLLPTLKRLKN